MERLQAALDLAGNTHTMADVAAMLERGEARAFGDDSAVGVYETVRYPQFDALRVWLMAGEKNAVISSLPTYERMAREIGAARVECLARRGWERAFIQFGAKPLATLYVKGIV
jgi:hypothetical protein